MSNEELLHQVMALPLAERIEMVHALWDSIVPEVGPDVDDRETIEEALRRDAELESGAVAGLTHEEVMEDLRRVIECD